MAVGKAGKRALPSAVAQPALSIALPRRGSGEPAVGRRSLSGLGTKLAQALAGQFDAVGVVNDAVEDGVGERGNPDQVVPTVDGNLAGDDRASPYRSGPRRFRAGRALVQR